MRKYESPKMEVFQIENKLFMMASSAQCAYSYHSRSQATEIRKQFEHMYSSISQKQKKMR